MPFAPKGHQRPAVGRMHGGRSEVVAHLQLLVISRRLSSGIRRSAASGRFALVGFALVFASGDPNGLGAAVNLDLDLLAADDYALFHFSLVGSRHSGRRSHHKNVNTSILYAIFPISYPGIPISYPRIPFSTLETRFLLENKLLNLALFL